MAIVKRRTVDYREGEAISPTNLSQAKVESFAAEVAKSVHFKVGGSITDLVNKLGGRIQYQEFDEILEESGSIFVHAKNDFDILLPHYTSPVRDHFTVAHELGHYFLHADQGGIPLIAYRSGSTRIEWEANWFAAALLMPRVEFTEAMLRTDDVAVDASQFAVSPAAVRVRKDALKL